MQTIKTEDQEKRDANRDPISGAPGAHPLGTGIGAAAGAMGACPFTIASVGKCRCGRTRAAAKLP